MSKNEMPEELKYTKTHEWSLKESDDIIVMGITAHAQDLLGDMVFVELPEVGDSVHAMDELGVVESVKAASDFYAPVSGEVIAVNEDLADSPALVNTDPYSDGWLVKIKMTDPEEYDELLSAEDYSETLDEE